MSDPPLVLELDLTEPVITVPPTDRLDAIRARRRVRLGEIVDGLRRAASDERVAGLLAKIGGMPCGLATAQEIRSAVAAFRATGRFAIAWSETFGEFAAGTVGYYVATAFDRIVLGESGDVGLLGVGGRAFFIRDALERVGVRAEMGQRHEYKNAANTFTRSGLTEAHREALDAVVASFADQIVAGVATARGCSAAEVRELIDRAPLSAAEALAAGLVDRVGYRDEVYAGVRAQVGGEVELRYVHRYKPAPARAVAQRVRSRRSRHVGVVYIAGAITTGRSGNQPIGGARAGSDTVAAALRAAVRDDDVTAIVVRVESPGGSYVASDAIRREVVLARRAGKPVVVSMGEVAGSGGYFVSMAARVILAAPATITGSIGVFGGKAVIDRVLERAGVGVEAVSRGAHALMFSARWPFSDDERALLDRWLDRVYDDFTAKVAADRAMSRARVHEIARGRIWTGADARDRGLVDDLGGFADAIALARRRGGLPARDDLADVRVFPQLPVRDRVRRPQSSEHPGAAAMRLSAWGRFAPLAAALGLPAAGPLTMPPLDLR